MGRSGVLDPKLRADIIAAFQQIKDPALLDLLRAKRYEPVSVAEYRGIEREARRLGLLSGG